MDHPLINFIKNIKPLADAEEKLLAETFELKKVKDGEYLFHAGKVCRELYFIADGVLRIFGLNEKGNEVTRSFLKENQFCSILHSFYNQDLAEDSIQAATYAEIYVASRQNLFELYEQLPYVKDLIDEINQQSMMRKIKMRNAYQGEDSASRYQLFLKLQPEIATRVSMNNIASYLGITPQSLSRIRRNTK